MNTDPEPLRRLARESGRALGELGVRPDDRRWIALHAAAVASLLRKGSREGLRSFFYRLARRAARTAR